MVSRPIYRINRWPESKEFRSEIAVKKEECLSITHCSHGGPITSHEPYWFLDRLFDFDTIGERARNG